MVVIVDVTVPADTFELGRLLEEFPGVEIEIERLVPLRDRVLPLFWVDGTDAEPVLSVLRSSPLTDSARVFADSGDSRLLFEVRWTSAVDGLVTGLVETGATMLAGMSTGTGEAWEFRLQFPSHEQLSAFHDFTETREIPLTVHRVYRPQFGQDTMLLTREQSEAISYAYEHGYFEVPRRTTATELAAHFGISDNAFSQRLRRGLSALIEETMARDGE